jgi:hypothetical protein
MMISYFHLLRIIASRQMVLHDQRADLSDLIRLPVPSSRLQIQDLRHTFLGENVVVAADALVKAQAPEQVAQIFEWNVRIGTTAQNPKEESFVLFHAAFLQQLAPVA